jgi:hypothetical protein
MAGGLQLSDSSDPAEAALRLEEALERIAALVDRLDAAPAAASASVPASVIDPATVAVAARLDALIARLRSALAGRPA